jgi:alpha-galactosidase
MQLQTKKLTTLLIVAAFTAHADDNGRAITPTQGWRSWNQFQGEISQTIMESAMTVLASRTRTVDGVPTSFADLGFSDAGVDDNWQDCNGGTSGYTYHNAETGRPAVNTVTFPDMKGMVDFAHNLNLTSGFYSNNCICHDHCNDTICFAGDVDQVLDWGFDSIKLDGCGKEENIELWRNLFNWTMQQRGLETGMLLENCHNGPNTPRRGATPSEDWCPFHMYRASTDIAPVYGSILANLQTIIPLAAQNLSWPGCWAYTDSKFDFLFIIYWTHSHLTIRPLLTLIFYYHFLYYLSSLPFPFS